MCLKLPRALAYQHDSLGPAVRDCDDFLYVRRRTPKLPIVVLPGARLKSVNVTSALRDSTVFHCILVQPGYLPVKIKTMPEYAAVLDGDTCKTDGRSCYSTPMQER